MEAFPHPQWLQMGGLQTTVFKKTPDESSFLPLLDFLDMLLSES